MLEFWDIGCEDSSWMEQAQDHVQQQTFVLVVMDQNE
jgi:hypothetical protein